MTGYDKPSLIVDRLTIDGRNMFKEPKNYIDDNHFFFSADNDLEKVCNAPKDKQGVFKILELKNGKINLVFLGCTNFADTQSNDRGLYDEIVHGLHYDKNPRKMGWTYQLIKDKVDAIDIYWYVTPNSDNPKTVLTDLLKQHVNDYGKLPKWNK